MLEIRSTQKEATALALYFIALTPIASVGSRHIGQKVLQVHIIYIPWKVTNPNVQVSRILEHFLESDQTQRREP